MKLAEIVNHMKSKAKSWKKRISNPKIE